MSAIVKKRVNLVFMTGQLEEDIAIEDENQPLGEFIESALGRLEVNYNSMIFRDGFVSTVCAVL